MKLEPERKPVKTGQLVVFKEKCLEADKGDVGIIIRVADARWPADDTVAILGQSGEVSTNWLSPNAPGSILEYIDE